MSTKRFCDVSTKEIVRSEGNAVTARIKGTAVLRGKAVLIEVIVGTGKTWNTGDVCVPCVLDAVENVGRPAMQAVAS